MANARWYVLHAYSGYEKKVSESIIEQSKKLGISEFIEEVSVPTQNIVEVKMPRERVVIDDEHEYTNKDGSDPFYKE